MKKNLLYVFSVGLIGILFSVTAFAQTAQQREDRRTVSAASSLYVISAKAGAVNYVEGKVSVARQEGKSGYLLKGDELEIGDVVSTGADGRAEILLNPGSFVRLAENSVFEFASTALEDLQLNLKGGSAMLEVITDNEFTFAVNTPKAKLFIVKSGVYRVDVLSDGTGKIEVWKGSANANGTEIKSGRQATVSGNQTAVVKFDRDDKDALEVWSKSRAKELSKINARLQNNYLRTSLMSSYYQTRWSLYDSYGLWVYSRYHGSYCFLPFGYGWSSPYGYYYPRDIWYYNLPPVIYNPPPPTTTTTT
ncbi:MAG: FecR domain-containing protein, partial [Acidobacteriota bacterium]|nr:FecR domain-containing protein [Acidobacteriota bacterium]